MGVTEGEGEGVWLLSRAIPRRSWCVSLTSFHLLYLSDYRWMSSKLMINIMLLCYRLLNVHVPYSWKIWWFGGQYYNRRIKIRQNFLLAYIHMVILYRTAKFKSANVLEIAILGSTAKFNSCQYFRLYGRICSWL